MKNSKSTIVFILVVLAISFTYGWGGRTDGNQIAAPNNLVATAVSSAQINLTWADNSKNEFGFKIGRKTGAGGTYAEVAVVGAGVTSYQNSGLVPSTKYFYQIRAYNAAGESAYSDEVNATTHEQIEASRITSDASNSKVPSLGWTGAEYSKVPSLVWTGTEYGVSWQDDRDGNSEIYFSRISSTGIKIGEDIRITFSPGKSENPFLVWNGTEYGVSWQEGWEIYFSRVSTIGVQIGQNIRIISANDISEFPALVWTGSEYGVSWDDARDGKYAIFFARISSVGVKIGEDTRITLTTDLSSRPALVWTGSEYGISWYRDNRKTLSGDDVSLPGEIHFLRMSSSGAKIGGDISISSDASFVSSSSLSWTGSEYGVSWTNGDGHISFSRISSSGAKIGRDVRISPDSGFNSHSSLVWTGSEYGVSWFVFWLRERNFEIYFARISSAGTKVGGDIKISSAVTTTNHSLVWTGSEYGLSWQDYRDGNNEIYLGRFIGVIP